MAIFKTKFDITEEVYVKHDREQNKWQVVEISFQGSRNPLYTLHCGPVEIFCYEFSLSYDVDVIKKMS